MFSDWLRSGVGRVDCIEVFVELVTRMIGLVIAVVTARGTVNPAGVVRDTDLLGVSPNAELTLVVISCDDVDEGLLYTEDSLVYSFTVVLI